MVGIGGVVHAVLKLSPVVFYLPFEQNKMDARCVKNDKAPKNNESNICQAVYKTTSERVFTFTATQLFYSRLYASLEAGPYGGKYEYAKVIWSGC
ncbi:MAG: hypothetical protein LBH74_07660 [Nitrososphaerota archaeon]|jgi:hypothetical protein|uniref:hypothetical protein n=1 Tax=Candidatus Bathycorpusculum sp. TaxID=2994959 RepID=UPI002818B3E5|nr:hypothetical protein [Candidatus Termitimicrobium sp.]MDR0493494.1 hypothetical protein [Nitrososphaerota archaeon]